MSESMHQEMEKIKKAPYQYIQSWMEGVVMHIGKRVFEIAALQPCSHIIPDIPMGTNRIRAQINMFLLAPPGSGKSTICKKFAEISYNPIMFRKITPAELAVKISESPMFTIINEDFSQIAGDYAIIKVLEGALGDEKNVSHHTLKRHISQDTQGVGLICGTPLDLVRQQENLAAGLMSRLVPLMINYSDEQRDQIGDYITKTIGEEKHVTSSLIVDEVVKNYYVILRQIQNGEYPEIPPIAKYDIPQHIKEQIGTTWKMLMGKVDIGSENSWLRELHETYRFLIAHAFLNVFNRKVTPFVIEDEEKKKIKLGILSITEEDLAVAISLMKKNIIFKSNLAKATAVSENIRNAQVLAQLLKDPDLPDQVKNIILNISRFREEAIEIIKK